MRFSLLAFLFAGTSLSLVACAAPASDDVGSNEQHATADIDHMFRRPDGRYDVFCADGSTETLTAEDINNDVACGGPSSSTSSGSGGSGAGATCLDPTPIDATQFAYTKATPKANACTTRELTLLSAYYRAHAADADFTTTAWATSVSAGCASCVFTDETNGPAAAWGPIVTKGGELDRVNRGGCIEQVSGSEACGRAYQQYQDCLLDACLSQCQTQEEFTRCRMDQTVLTTSCKGAVATLQGSCDTAKIPQYETACKGTTYTFEGPIKQACIGTP